MSMLKPFSFSTRFPNFPIIAANLVENYNDIIPLSFGFPAPETLPTKLLSEATDQAMQTQGTSALSYMGGTGPKKVVQWIKDRSKLRSIDVSEKEIIVTNGSMQAIDLATRTLTDPGDQVWIEGPSFFGAIRVFNLAEVGLRSFPIDEHGLRVDLVEQALIEAKANQNPLPKMIYVMPNYHNPGGVNLSLERRKKLAELAYEYNFYVLEDDAYVELNFKQHFLPSIHSFGPERVIYLSTFSKLIAPGIRMGWAIANEEVINKMRILKVDGSTSVFVQEVVHNALEQIDLPKHIDLLISLYRSRKDAMVAAINEYFGDDVTFIEPNGGFFLWLTFNEDVNTSAFLQKAFELGVSYLDGYHFFLQEEGFNHIRLCFTYCDEEQIKKGIKLLATAYYEYTKNQPVLEGEVK
ncbi:PLP-dependent aminotransferase family protein [Bacillus sp. 03113]|uniref:aminotransferase-like domain-containing protein n=1 Tax=Bacillus sp. 03113 TaxID=2578211 RepID=UPI0011445B6C|nr:PLP-dependent aminotransferase family protein [Bacillus sp. 03113]